MNWRKYEANILEYFTLRYPDQRISFDQQILGRYSKVKRQVDILIEGEVAGYDLRIIVDCKYFSKNVDVKAVESFCSMVDDLDAHQGILITNKGYSKAAINRAFYGNSQIELDVLNFDALRKYQSFCAIPYKGDFSVMVLAPFGWVLDLEDTVNSFASLHQRGVSFSDAKRKMEFMYMQFWVREIPDFKIMNLIREQNENLLIADPQTTFEMLNGVLRKDGRETMIRVADIKKHDTLEITGFIEFENHIFFIVLFTPRELRKRNLRKLQFVLETAIPAQIDFDNTQRINQFLAEIEMVQDKLEQSKKFYQVGIWCQEMKNLDSAMKYFLRAIECCPNSYLVLKNVLGKALFFNKIEDSRNLAFSLFNLEPKNPTLAQDLIEVYSEHKKLDLLIDIFKELNKLHTLDEVLGNINFHLAIIYWRQKKINNARDSVEIATGHFQNALPRTNRVFKAIRKFNKLLVD